MRFELSPLPAEAASHLVSFGPISRSFTRKQKRSPHQKRALRGFEALVNAPVRYREQMATHAGGFSVTAANSYDLGLGRNSANYVALSPLSFLRRTAAVYPDRLAVIHGSFRTTWRDTYARSRRRARRMEKMPRKTAVKRMRKRKPFSTE